MKPKRTILCVDEDERSLSIRKVMLETRGYRVMVCSDAGRAVELMKVGGIDLVLADLMMLKLGSARLIDQLKAISPSTPTILLSGTAIHCPDEILADIFLSKANCSAVQLLDHIRMALVRKRGPKPALTGTADPGRLAS